MWHMQLMCGRLVFSKDPAGLTGKMAFYSFLENEGRSEKLRDAPESSGPPGPWPRGFIQAARHPSK